jgi:hypothetical protein
MFTVDDGQSPRGFVVLFEASNSPQEAVYVVRNLYQQDLGIVDAWGRAFRYQPHEDDPEWVGSGSVIRGVQQILSTATRPESPARLLFSAHKNATDEPERTR